MDSKLLDRINSTYFNSLAWISVKGNERKYFGNNNIIRQSCIIITWLFKLYMDTAMKEVKMGVSLLEDEREWRLPSLLYADDLVLCGESEEDLGVMVGRFAEVCSRRRRKVNAAKCKVMALNGEEGLECEVYVDRIRLEHVS